MVPIGNKDQISSKMDRCGHMNVIKELGLSQFSDDAPFTPT
jgi:hypothetical protein